MNDLKYAFRRLVADPGYTLIALLTLGLGIGATTAVFSVVDGVLLAPLPYRDPDALALIWHHNAKTGDSRYPVSYETYLALREETDRFESVAGLIPFDWSMTLRTDDGAERLAAQFISASLLPTLGVLPALGRGSALEEDERDGPPAALLSHELWQRAFGGDSTVVGGSISLNDSPVSVVGVMPPGFKILEEVDLWLPLARNPLVARGRQVYWMVALGRLASGVSLDEAAPEVATVMRRLELEYPESNSDLGASLVPLHEQVVGDSRKALGALLGGVGFVLLIACANIAGLSLARALRRRPELAVRAALGAGRGSLARALLVENMLLAVLGGLAGTAIAYWSVDLIRGLAALDVPRLENVAVDVKVLAFAAAITLVTGLLFGLAPALHAGRAAPADVLKGARHGGSTRARRFRAGLVVAEVALALMLLTGAGLLLRSFVGLLGVDPGFDVNDVLTFQMALPSGKYNTAEERLSFYDRLFDELASIPGADAAGGVTRLPLVGSSLTTKLDFEDEPVSTGERPEIEFRRASPDYFAAMGIAIDEGRGITDADGPESTPVVVINRAAARRFWPSGSPVGARIRPNTANPDATPWYEIVGVVEDVRHFGLEEEARAEMYVPFAQGTPPGSPLVAVRAADAGTLAGAVRNRIRRLDPDIVTWNVATMADRLAGTLAARRFGLWLTGAFAAFALVLAALGIYGVLSYGVAQRTREIGVRVALGARAGDVARLVARQGLVMTGLGIALGLLGATALGRLVQGLLYGVQPIDPLTLVAVSVVLGGVAFVAAWVPARRAAQIDPVRALRYE